jgi:hypothetical protein
MMGASTPCLHCIIAESELVLVDAEESHGLDGAL